jgi:hypothetical protein
VLTQSPDLAALHFTGSTSTFNHLWRSISTNISKYSYITPLTFQHLPFMLAYFEFLTFFQLSNISTHSRGNWRQKFPFRTLFCGCW